MLRPAIEYAHTVNVTMVTALFLTAMLFAISHYYNDRVMKCSMYFRTVCWNIPNIRMCFGVRNYGFQLLVCKNVGN